MEVPGSDSDWRSPQFRQRVVKQIEEAMRKAGTAHTKSSNDMENHVYVKAKSREEYLSLVARLIIHFRDIHKKAHGGPGPGQMQVVQAQQQQQSIQFQQFQQAQQAQQAQQQQQQNQVPGPDSDWRSPPFRQLIVELIEEVVRKAGAAHTKPSNDMENHVYVKAKSREEYLSLVARLIMHVHKRAHRQPGDKNAEERENSRCERKRRRPEPPLLPAGTSQDDGASDASQHQQDPVLSAENDGEAAAGPLSLKEDERDILAPPETE
ncbi:uncharacterized protein ACJ7VT_021667 isoform 2-T2 [Polymixia lowei]